MNFNSGSSNLNQKLINKEKDLFSLQKQAALYSSIVPIELLNKISTVQDEIDYLKEAISKLPDAEKDYLVKLMKADELKRWTHIFVSIPVSVNEKKPDFPEKEESGFPIRSEFESLTLEQAKGKPKIIRQKLNDLFEAINKYDKFVLVGPPGSGKTTALEKLTWEMSNMMLKKGPNSFFPILLRLSNYYYNEDVISWIGRTIEHDWQADLISQNIEKMLSDGRLLLVFDALNEMPTNAYEKKLLNLKDFIDKLPDGNRCIVSCRILDYVHDLGPQIVEIVPLNKEQISKFFQYYLGKSSGDELFNEVLKRNLLDLARIPYFSAMFSYVYQQNGKIPLNQGKLLNAFIDTLLNRESRLNKEKWIPSEVLKLVLTEVAFEANSVIGLGAIFNMDWLLSFFPKNVRINKHIWKLEPEYVLRQAVNANILEIKSNLQTMQFSHELIQEFFAGKKLVCLSTSSKNMGKYWKIKCLKTEMSNDIKSPSWRTPIAPPSATGWEQATILGAGSEDDASIFLEMVLSYNSLLAAKCIIEGKAVLEPSLRNDIISELIRTIDDPSVSIRVRIEAGDLLGELGDQRLSSTQMVRVPSGVFIMGNNGTDAFENPIPTHNVGVDSFLIGKYPVTFQEYECFVLDKGYENPIFWTKKGWEWKTQKNRHQPDLWDEPTIHRLNCPVVGVSWYEAMAYAKWAGKRLPTEAEWEKAASWNWDMKHKRAYPWGDGYCADKMNINDGDEIAGRMTPVGIYSDGASYSGCLDMAGNVWEWCSSSYKNYPYSANDGREDVEIEVNRVMRGGTFWSEPAFASSAMRFKHFPGYSFDVAGFRLAADEVNTQS